MTAMAWCISFSILDTFLVKRVNPLWYCRFCFTANANPVLLVGGGMPDGLDCDQVPMDGGALLIAAAATCALVLAQVVVSSGAVARCMAPTLRFLLCSCLAVSAVLVIVAC
jgi:hypothetical protein